MNATAREIAGRVEVQVKGFEPVKTTWASNGVAYAQYPRFVVLVSQQLQCKVIPIQNGPQEETNGLGDRIEKILKSVGITEEQYKHLKELAGYDPTCGCPARKEFLNRIVGVLIMGYARGGAKGAWKAAVKLAEEVREKHA